MKAGRLVEGCRQWGLFLELQRRPEGMTTLQAWHFLAENGIQAMIVKDELEAIRQGAPEHGWRLLPAMPERATERGRRVYRYKLVKTSSDFPGTSSLFNEGIPCLR